MPKRREVIKTVQWLSEEIPNDQNFATLFHYYQKFQFNELIAEVGEFVLVSNADAAEPDTEEGCDAAKILSLYEDQSNKNNPFRAKVQWYSRPYDLPNGCLNNCEHIEFYDKEVVEDHRPFDTDVSIETFFKKCSIILSVTKDNDEILKSTPFHYICRYRLIAAGRKKVNLEPVLEEERKALQLLCTPNKRIATRQSKTPKTPSTLVKRMSRVSISEKNWSVSKNDGTKLLLKRAILADKNEKASPKATPKSNKSTPVIETPKSSKKINKMNLEEVISMELKENSDEELPTLIIRRHVPTTPKRKTPQRKVSDETPKKVLVFEDDERETHTPYATRSGRVTKNPICYQEDVSPVKRTPRRTVRKDSSCSEDDFKVIKTPKVPKTPKTPKTPRARNSIAKTPKSVSRRILTSELTPTLHTRAHSVDNADEFLTENKSLPGRENQMHEILSFVRSKLLHGISGCMYISGVPGTGKTATVSSALKILKEEPDLPDFLLVEVNGMRISEPRQAYVQIYKQLTGKSVVWEQACSLLEKRFTNPGPRRTPTVLLVDELDALCNRRQDVLYSIMEWAAHNTALLSVLAVANTMDLPERALASRVASRLGLTRLTFPPYTHSQLQCIVVSRLAGANVTPDAVQLIARKVAAVSGDARRALALCARSLELAGAGGSGLQHVQLAGAGGAGLQHVQLAGAGGAGLQHVQLAGAGGAGLQHVQLAGAGGAGLQHVQLAGAGGAGLQHVQLAGAGGAGLQHVQLAGAGGAGLQHVQLAGAGGAGLQHVQLAGAGGAGLQHVQLAGAGGAGLQHVQLAGAGGAGLQHVQLAGAGGAGLQHVQLAGAGGAGLQHVQLAGAGGAGLQHVQLALDEAASSAPVRAIRNCSPAERLVLRAVAAEVERTGSDETTLSRVLQTAGAIVALDGRPYRSAPNIRPPTASQAQTICARLAALKLLLMEPKPSEPRILLNVSADDVHYATKQISV